MWRCRKSSKRLTGDEKKAGQEKEANWIFSRLKRRLARWKIWMLRCLEAIDARLSNQQRRWLFYIGILCWSSFLFYLLGTAIRRPPSSFVLPFAADSSQLSLRQFNNRVPEQRSIRKPHKTETNIGKDTDYAPLKINSHGTRKSD